MTLPFESLNTSPLDGEVWNIGPKNIGAINKAMPRTMSAMPR